MYFDKVKMEDLANITYYGDYLRGIQACAKDF